MSMSAGSGRSWRARAASSTSARTPNGWCSSGPFVAPSRCQVQDGRLVIADGVTAPKFLADVEQRTFSGEYAVAIGQPVLYVTERCVFELTPEVWN